MNGAIIYRGPSSIDGAPIVVIATGLKAKSRNSKTGEMVQTYIIRSDMGPLDAVRTGADASICGTCPHRGDGTGAGRSCYVTLIHGPSAVWRGFQNGSYPEISRDEAAELLAGRMVRLGTYGDPAAAPLSLWQDVLQGSEGWTGYTHQWAAIDPTWARYVMASADSMMDGMTARAKGYRTFRVTAEPFANLKGAEVSCPASEEMGKRAACIACKACMGTSGKARVSITIAAHGTGARHAVARAA